MARAELGRGSGKLEIPTVGEGCSVSDFLSLRLQASTTPLFGIAKPGTLLLTFVLSDGKERSQRILLAPDGLPHDVLVSACHLEEPLFASHFCKDRCWRASQRVQSIRLLWVPLDPLSRKPAEIELQATSVVRRSGVEVFESNLADQGRSDIWDWCFANGPRPPVEP
jgi:hypothetical protein